MKRKYHNNPPHFFLNHPSSSHRIRKNHTRQFNIPQNLTKASASSSSVRTTTQKPRPKEVYVHEFSRLSTFSWISFYNFKNLLKIPLRRTNDDDDFCYTLIHCDTLTHKSYTIVKSPTSDYHKHLTASLNKIESIFKKIL